MTAWKRHAHGSILKKGDVLRMKVRNPLHPHNGQYAYAMCTGGGFGCQPDTNGNAIFVKYVRYNLYETLSYRKSDLEAFSPEESARWERFWNIEYLVDEEGVNKSGKNQEKVPRHVAGAT